jgi:NAD(P)-dependent dehydrogenase (short-subunit alcohol dehydrogenase family)
LAPRSRRPSRDTSGGERSAADIAATSGNPDFAFAGSTLPSGRRPPRLLKDWRRPLDLLINDAVVMALAELELTLEGWKLQFATNHLGHFVLAVGLHDALAASGGAGIVSLSSVADLRSPVMFEDVNFAHRPYDRRIAYGQSKTANAPFAVEAARGWAGQESRRTRSTQAP